MPENGAAIIEQAALAQSVEQPPCKRKRVGSRPTGGSIKFPSRIRIGQYDYEIKRMRREQLTDALGATDFDNVIIWMRTRLKRDKQREVLLHEVLHACLHNAGICDDKARTDEEWIAAVTPTLVWVLQHNPRFIKFLTDVSSDRPEQVGRQAPVERGNPASELRANGQEAPAVPA